MTDPDIPKVIPGHFADSDAAVHSKLLNVIAGINGDVPIDKANGLAWALTHGLREHRLGLLDMPSREERHGQDAVLWWELTPYDQEPAS